MELKVSKKELVDALGVVARATSKGSSLPVLMCALISAQRGTEADWLELTATDLKQAARVRLPAKVIDSGNTVADVNLLLQLIKSMKGEEVRLEIPSEDSNVLNVLDETTQFRLTTMPSDEFPNINRGQDYPKALSINTSTLAQTLKQVLWAAKHGREDAETILAGVLFSLCEDTLKLVASDGHRMALKKFFKVSAHPVAPDQIKVKWDALVPAAFLANTLPVLKARPKAVVDIYIGFPEPENQAPPEEQSLEPNAIEFRFNTDLSLSTLLIEGNYPNYEQVIPKESDINYCAILEKTSFEAALQRLAVVANRSTGTVKLGFSQGIVKLTSKIPGESEATDELPLEFQGPDLIAAFNVNYLLDSLRAIEAGAVELKFAAPDRPMIVEPLSDKSIKHLIMPVRLDERETRDNGKEEEADNSEEKEAGQEEETDIEGREKDV